ncbi:hypothetical protein HPB48_020972 [Haemaphysalis longicornis]|uniref:Uncharacterized protein n=1 Tax=Haemaphysalis longicornis TaxID=44386 RepID=A0A9J6FDL1_HAELO|nr:hypothetical protein HPB48_020972 [Haemaphysalis longicornis]
MPQWAELTVRHCIILRNLSAKAYEHLSSEGLLRLPCRNTLQKYIGNSSGGVGLSDLVRCHFETKFTELQALDSPQAKVCGLVVDEM